MSTMAKKSSKYKPEMLLYHKGDPSVVIKLLYLIVEGSDTQAMWVYIYPDLSQVAHLEYKREEDLDLYWTIHNTVDNDKEEEWV